MGRSRRRKKMTSILPDSLDVIEECPEEMESSVTSIDFDPNSPQKPRARKIVISSSEDMEDFEDGSYSDDEEESPEEDQEPQLGPVKLSPVEEQEEEEEDGEERPENDSNPHNDPKDQLTDDKSDDTAGTASTTNSNEGGRSTPPPPDEPTSTQLDPPESPRKNLYDYDADYSTPHKPVDHSKTKGEDSPTSPPMDENVPSSAGGDAGDILSWRLPAEESLSDWTIKVKNRDDGGSVETYHVHKSMLASGKRKSEYFVQAFKKSSKDLTEVSLYGAAAKAMPHLLDFMYDIKTPRLKAENAVGLRFLAQFFGIKVLFKKVMDFIQKDLSLATMPVYVRDSTNLKDDKLLGIAARHCARNILKIEKSHKLLHYLDGAFILRLILSPGIVSDERRRHLSVLVLSFCKMHKDRVDGALFQKLTSEAALPVIHRDAALGLLDLEADIVVATSLDSFSQMTSLQERCIKHLASHWKDLTASHPKETARVCRKLPSFVVTELLMQSLAKAAASSDASGRSSRSKSNPRGSDDGNRAQMAKAGSLRVPRNSEPLPERGIGTKSKSLRIGGEPAPSRGLGSKTASLKMKKSDSPPSRGLGSKAASLKVKSGEAPPSRGLGLKSASLKVKKGEADPARGLHKGGSVRVRPGSEPGKKRSFEDRVADLKSGHRDELATLKREYESNLMKLRDMCVEKDKHISNYWDEIKKFERLPNNPEGKLVSSGLLHGQASKLPEIGNYPKEGYLLSSKRSGTKYPLFYYNCDTS